MHCTVKGACHSAATYILLCDLLMNVHVTQAEAQLPTFCHNCTVCGRPLLLQPGHTTCVLRRQDRNANFFSIYKMHLIHTAVDIPYVYSG